MLPIDAYADEDADLQGEYNATCVGCGKWIGIGLACNDCDVDEDADLLDTFDCSMADESEARRKKKA